MWWRFQPYVSAAERRKRSLKEISRLEKKGHKLSPVRLDGRAIASTFWGQAWCRHLESYGDYSNRLPRGRSYVRAGAVLDLQIEPGVIRALVNGSSLYKIQIKIAPLAPATWNHIRKQVVGGIRGVIELLQGRLSNGVMAVVTDRQKGMFPLSEQIDMDCSCPDYAGMCKHLAAVLYGVGARLDTQPELLFTLRQVDHLELVPTADTLDVLTRGRGSARKTIARDQLADVFGVEIDAVSQRITAAASSTIAAVATESASKPATKKNHPIGQAKISKRRNPQKSKTARTKKRHHQKRGKNTKYPN